MKIIPSSCRDSERRSRMTKSSQLHDGFKVIIGMLIGAALLMSLPTYANSNLPLLEINQLEYKGAFRVPAGTYGTSSANFSFGAIGLNPARNSLFIAGHDHEGDIAEFPIPDLVNSRRLTDLPMAGPPIQNFANVINKADITRGLGIRISGIFYSDEKLMVNVYRFYDQDPYLQTPTMILDNANNIQASTTRGYLSVQGAVRAAGWVSPIPTIWRETLGGSHMMGFSSSTARAIIHNSSVGPSAYAFNPVTAMANSATINNIPSVELMSFTLANGLVATDDDLYNRNRDNNVWTHASEASFGMIVPGTRTYLVLGMSGGHESGMLYGVAEWGGYHGHNTIDEHDKYPYYWLFDVNDFVKVKNGQMHAYEVRPYSVGKFDAPFQTGVVNAVAGGSYDEATGTMYLSIFQADNGQGEDYNPPVIVGYTFNVAGTPTVARPSAPSNVLRRSN